VSNVGAAHDAARTPRCDRHTSSKNMHFNWFCTCLDTTIHKKYKKMYMRVYCWLTPYLELVRKCSYRRPQESVRIIKWVVLRLRMRGTILPHVQYVFMAWCLVKHRENFTLHNIYQYQTSTISFRFRNMRFKYRPNNRTSGWVMAAYLQILYSPFMIIFPPHPTLHNHCMWSSDLINIHVIIIPT